MEKCTAPADPVTRETEAQRLAALVKLVAELRPLSTWQMAERIHDLERRLDIWVPSWRDPSDDGHDLEDAMIHMQRRELEQLRARVAELEGRKDDLVAEAIERTEHGDDNPF
jgi:hypothetical protein